MIENNLPDLSEGEKETLDLKSEVKDILKSQLEEKVHNINLEEENPIQKIEKVNISKKILRTQVLGQIFTLSKKMGKEKPVGISKLKKEQLKEILSNLMEEAISFKQQNVVSLEEENEEEKEDELVPTTGPKSYKSLPEDVISNSLVRFTYIAMDISEKISKSYTPGGFYLDEWSQKFHTDPRMEAELKQCMVEIYQENSEWMEPMMNCYSRLWLLLASTGVMSIKSGNKNITNNIPNVIKKE